MNILSPATGIVTHSQVAAICDALRRRRTVRDALDAALAASLQDITVTMGSAAPFIVLTPARAATIRDMVTAELTAEIDRADADLDRLGYVADDGMSETLGVDPFDRFVAAMIEPANGCLIPAKIVHVAYQRWARANGEAAIHANLFARRMTDRGFARRKLSVMFYQDIKLAVSS